MANQGNNNEYLFEQIVSTEDQAFERQEWLAAVSSLVAREGAARAESLLADVLEKAKNLGAEVSGGTHTAYVNTVPASSEVTCPEDGGMAAKVDALIRWNAAAMVLRGGKKVPGLGGHIATFASSATLYAIGFDYFFRGRTDSFLGDMVFFQGHASPGIYARAFLEGRITPGQMENFRREVERDGLPSYPHPWLMGDFWQFPTVSMGLGPLQAIYQARFMKYLQNRRLLEADDRKVWAFLGDGEMDEPESLGALSIAARESLDNLIFVVNCNLQRLDGPVRGNGKIIQELEGIFRGAGWNVIKSIWGSKWDPLLGKDTSGLLQKRMMECVDGAYQNYVVQDGAYFREQFFGVSPELLAMVEHMTDEELYALAIDRAGHDSQKVYAAFHAAVNHTDQPTVVLVKTIKGYGMGPVGEAKNTTHQQKKMSTDDLKIFCARFDIPIAEDQLDEVPYYHPGEDSPEVKYMLSRRSEMGGFIPARFTDSKKLEVPGLEAFESQLASTEDREISTTMAFVRILSVLLRDKSLKAHIVPIVPDESRTFGMEGLFRQIGIYSPVGQNYEPVDKDQVMYYKESKTGQLLEEGINEAGAFSSWMAAGSSYSNHKLPMIPCYIYYSMFGFQRIADLAWAAGDLCTRGFLFGATAGRTTLEGEGLQHADGHSHVMASVIPNCVSYDPTYSYELTVIVQHGLQRMLKNEENVFFYITLMNENYQHPAMPEGVRDGIVKGMYLLKEGGDATHRVQLLGSGTILREVLVAAEKLEKEYDVAADVWSVTSFSELRRDGIATERYNRLHPGDMPKKAYVAECLDGREGPVIAATDYIRVHSDQIRSFIDKPMTVLGTDGFGRSDSRDRMRHFFEVDAKFIVQAALHSLFNQGEIDASAVKDAMKKLDIDSEKPDPVYC